MLLFHSSGYCCCLGGLLFAQEERNGEENRWVAKTRYAHVHTNNAHTHTRRKNISGYNRAVLYRYSISNASAGCRVSILSGALSSTTEHFLPPPPPPVHMVDVLAQSTAVHECAHVFTCVVTPI